MLIEVLSLIGIFVGVTLLLASQVGANKMREDMKKQVKKQKEKNSQVQFWSHMVDKFNQSIKYINEKQRRYVARNAYDEETRDYIKKRRLEYLEMKKKALKKLQEIDGYDYKFDGFDIEKEEKKINEEISEKWEDVNPKKLYQRMSKG